MLYQQVEITCCIETLIFMLLSLFLFIVLFVNVVVIIVVASCIFVDSSLCYIVVVH